MLQEPSLCMLHVVCCDLKELAVIDLAGAVLVDLLEHLRELPYLLRRQLREVGRRRTAGPVCLYDGMK